MGNRSDPPKVLWETFIPRKPVPCPRPRHHGKISYMPKEYMVEKSSVVEFLKSIYRGETISEPISVMLTFYLPRPKSVKREYPSVRPDIDNYSKLTLDAMTQAEILTDDALVVDLYLTKRYGEVGKVGTEVTIVGLS